MGPGKLSLALGVARVEDDGWKPKEIGCSPRIGVIKAKDRPLRFYV